MRQTLILTTVLVLTVSHSECAQVTTISAPDAVKNCVEVVHQTKASGLFGEMLRESYKNFDAFYNQATGNIEHNGFTNGDAQAYYLFKKCMAQSGWPLK